MSKMTLEQTLNATEEVVRRATKVLTEKNTSLTNLVLNPSHNTSASSEEPLPEPSLNYGNEQKQNEQQQGQGEQPLEIPALNFDKTNAEDKQNENKVNQSQGESALPLPSTA